MTTPPEDGERSICRWLRERVEGPAQPEQQPLVEVHVIEPPRDDQDDEQDQPEPDHPPWWHVIPGPWGNRTAPEPAPAPAPAPAPQETIAATPGIHVTVNQPVPEAATPIEDAYARERRRRRQLWGAYHGSAAAVGWYVGLADQMADLLAQAGHGAPAAGLAMAAVTYIVASYLPGLPYMPPALRPITVWAARIPVSTAVLALALYAPGHV